MHIADTLRGIGLVLFIVIVAGTIAYAGDRVGHNIGRKRLTLFGIRPRYTSTIVAVGTGMFIAFVVTLGAILASQEVKTAFFRLNALNAQIEALRNREQAVESTHVVINVNTVMSPYFVVLSNSQSRDQRLQIVRRLYADTAAYVNTRYRGAPLRPFVPPKDLDQRLAQIAYGDTVAAMLSRGNVLVLAAADQNVYPHDPIAFALHALADVPVFRRGQFIWQLRIPANRNVVPAFALQQLENSVAMQAERNGMPVYFVGNVQPAQYFPSPAEIQRDLTTGSSGYAMTAFAATDVYPHTVAVPIVVTLQKL